MTWGSARPLAGHLWGRQGGYGVSSVSSWVLCLVEIRHGVGISLIIVVYSRSFPTSCFLCSVFITYCVLSSFIFFVFIIAN